MGDTMSDDEYGTPHPHTHDNEGIRTLMDLQMQDHMLPQITELNSERQGPQVHVKVVEGTPQDIRSQTPNVNVIPPTNRWTNWTH